MSMPSRFKKLRTSYGGGIDSACPAIRRNRADGDLGGVQQLHFVANANRGRLHRAVLLAVGLGRIAEAPPLRSLGDQQLGLVAVGDVEAGRGKDAAVVRAARARA